MLAPSTLASFSQRLPGGGPVFVERDDGGVPFEGGASVDVALIESSDVTDSLDALRPGGASLGTLQFFPH